MIIQDELQPVKLVMSRDYIDSNTNTKSLAPSSHPPHSRVGSKYTTNPDKTNPAHPRRQYGSTRQAGAPAVNMDRR